MSELMMLFAPLATGTLLLVSDVEVVLPEPEGFVYSHAVPLQ
jgi:hypothetical protein